MDELSGHFDLNLDKESRKRLVIVRIYEHIFVEILKAISIEGLPQDVQLQAWAYDFDTGSIKLQFWSQEFDNVAEGERIPTREIVVSSWKIHLSK